MPKSSMFVEWTSEELIQTQMQTLIAVFLVCLMIMAASARSREQTLQALLKAIADDNEGANAELRTKKVDKVEACAWTSSETCEGEKTCADLALKTCLNEGSDDSQGGASSQKFTLASDVVTQRLWEGSDTCSGTPSETVTYNCQECMGDYGISIKFKCSEKS